MLYNSCTLLRAICILAVQLFMYRASAQIPSSVNNIVEGGRVLVELVKVFKKPPLKQDLMNTPAGSSDICFSNNTSENLLIELSKKINDTTYKILPGALSLTANAHECLLNVSPNVYHYKVYKKTANIQTISLEGDLRLQPDEKMEREIK